MLVQYAVRNFKSIKDEIIINFTADKKSRKNNWVTMQESQELYKAIGLIGPNASGKTNIVESIVFAFRFILGTISRRESAKINIERFGFDESHRVKPATFEFIFYQDHIKYVYGFSVNEKEVLEEYLMGYFSAKAKTLFERNGQNFEFKGNDAKLQKEIAQKTNRNRLYMPVAAEWGYAPIKIAYEWFGFISRQYLDFNVISMIEEIAKDKIRKSVLIKELQNADFNIKDIYIKKKKMSKEDYGIIQRLLSEVVNEMGEISIPESSATIHVVHENAEGQTFDIPLDEDSAGTETIVQNIAELLYISADGGLMIEDELGKAYHTKLTQHFLAMVKSPDINNGGAQLLFTSHDTKVLNLMNPDQIYLVDKDESGSTIVKLLSDYIIRENDNIELGYLKGRYGSVPYMKG